MSDLDRFLEEMGLREKREPEPRPKREPPKPEGNEWYKRGEECPF